MTRSLTDSMRETIAAALQRQTITRCSDWACKYRVIGGGSFPGPWTFKYHPWAREMHDCESELMVGQKGAQLAFTETALNKVFYTIDLLRESVLYILPSSDPGASDFSKSRFDPALEASPHLRTLFSDVKNVGHKRAGMANLFIRGSHSREQMKSLPVARIIADEVDEMNQDNLVLAFERMSGQMHKQAFLLSTPTLSGIGINKYYLDSTQEHYMFKCPSCSRMTELIFPDCLVVVGEYPSDPRTQESHIVCKECKARLPHEDKHIFLSTGIWVPTFANRLARGFHVNQLYSSTESPARIVQNYLKSLSDPTEEQEFYNSKLGLPHEVEGARITDAHLQACKGNYKSFPNYTGQNLVTMGIDVGKFLHYEIDEWYINLTVPTPDINLMADCRVLKAGTVTNFSELDQLMQQYRVVFAVIDNQPETRAALEFCQRWMSRAYSCHYDSALTAKQLRFSDVDKRVNANRTSWLDLSLGRFKSGKIKYPFDIDHDYQNHMKTLVRVYEKDKNGNPVGRYQKPDKTPDHYAHARNYAEIALPLAVSLIRSENLNDVW